MISIGFGEAERIVSLSISDGIFDVLRNAFELASVLTAVASVLVAAVAGIFSVKAAKNGKIELSIGQLQSSDTDSGSVAQKDGRRPFEIEALANYYNQALARAKISFWFSIVFASIGFGVIIFAFATHNSTDIAGTVVKVISGTVIDAVSSLFFFQSTNAQKTMGDFFEKLRLDRLNAEAREMIAEVENVERRDQLRAQLILKYSGIDRLLVGG